MRARGEVMPSEMRGQMTVGAGALDWLQRLYQWFRSMSDHHRPIGPVSQYGTWDAHHEQFKPLRAESAADLLAEQHGAAWATRIYGGGI